MPVLCSSKKCGAKAILKRPKTGDALCKVAPFLLFEYPVDQNILIRTKRHPFALLLTPSLKECFFWAFETEVHFTIVKAKLFERVSNISPGLQFRIVIQVWNILG